MVRAADVLMDAYVNGLLPEVCAVTGRPTEDQIQIRSRVDQPGRGTIVLLLLLGPLGWVALVVMGLTGPTLTGWLPYSMAELSRRREQRRTMALASVLGSIGLVALGGILDVPVVSSLALPFLALGMVLVVALRYREPQIGLDASGRWVIIRRAHPNFVAAVEAARDQERSLPLL